MQFRVRSILLFIIFSLIILVIIYRLFTLMVLPKENIMLSSNSIRDNNLLRGNIYDRNGSVLAISVRSYNVVIYPDRIRSSRKLKLSDISEMSNILSEILDIDKDFVRGRLVSERMFEYLKKDVDSSTKELIKSYNFTGIDFEPTFRRNYPTKNLMSNVIGFVGRDNNGLEALERYFDDVLMGKLSGDDKYNDFFGYNLFLNIDKRIQEIVRDNIMEGVEKYNAKGGVGIVYNPMTAEILAMCSLPDYDPHTRISTVFSPVIELIEPGSVFKVFASTLLLENGIVTPDTIITANESIRFGNRFIYPNTPHQKLTFEEVIKYSSNVGMISNILKLEDELFYNGLKSFGFGRETGIDYPIESRGIFRYEEKMGSDLSKAMISIGYEISTTPIQLAVALGSFVNGGIISKPLLVSEIRDFEGKIVKRFTPQNLRFTPTKNKEVSDAMINIMRSVVRGGTGVRAGVDGLDIIGKTGTAQRFVPNIGYSQGIVNTTFFGIVKFLNDPIVILVLLNEPTTEIYASHTSAPIFSNIVRDLSNKGIIFEY